MQPLTMQPLRKVVRAARQEIRLRLAPKVVRINVGYDRDTARIVRTLPDNATCVDIGASNGDILAEMVEGVPNGTFYAFEARPDAAERVRDRFPQAQVHSMALGNMTGEVTFNEVNEDAGYSGLRRQTYPGDFTITEITVPIGRLDDVLGENAKVDFIKLDVEGAELEVLKGAEQICSQQKPTIVFEYGTAGRQHYDVEPATMFALLDSYGLGVSKLSDWLKGRTPMNLAQFERACERDWYFVASARR